MRSRVSGGDWMAQQLGGQQVYNNTTEVCESSVNFAIDTAPTASGDCLQVALAASNPGYNVDATPAAPLKKIIDTTGPGC